MTETDNLVLQLLGDMATKEDIARLDAKVDDVRSEVHSLRADVASDMLSLEKRLGDQMTGLRRSVMEYHSTVIGHGILYSEIEQHLNLVAPEAH